MPALPAVADCLKVAMQFNVDGSIQGGTNFHLSYTSGPPSGTDLGTMASAVESEWSSNLKPRFPTEMALVGVTVTDIASSSGAVGTWTGSVAGTSGSGVVSSSACVVINHEISRRYRGGKPRNYMPGVTQSDLGSGNELAPTPQADWLAAWSGMVSGILGGSYGSFTLQDIVSVSYYEGFTVVTNPITGRSRNVPTLRGTPLKDVIHASSVAKKLGSQRRRLRI
jgi:hypothetical protein